MDKLSVFIIAIGLSMDAFAISVANGVLIKNLNFKHAAKFGLFFGGFQFLMPVIGFFAASRFSSYISDYDHWLAFVLLSLIGAKMLYEAFKNDDKHDITDESEILSFKNLMILAIATSIDALAVGVSFAMVGSDIFVDSGIIGITTFTISFAGVMLSKGFGRTFQKLAEHFGGVVLIIIGVKILLEHLI